MPQRISVRRAHSGPMALCVPPPLAVSVSFMEHDLLDDLLEDIEINPNEATAARRPERPASYADAKPIHPQLDPLPLESSEARTEYYTVNDYVWPSPKKRQCRRMPEEERRQRHRESQREFMMRKRAQFRAMRAEISHLEKQLQWLEMRKTLKALTLEQQSLQANLNKVVASIHETVSK